MPEREPKDLVAVLLDPLTKPFARIWLGQQGYNKARNLLKKQHRDLYVKIHAKPSEDEEVQEELREEAQRFDSPAPEDSSSVIDDDVVDLTVADDVEDVPVDHEAEADKLFDRWINFKPKFNDFLYEGVENINNMNSCTISELIDKFDTAKYFQVRQTLFISAD